MKELTTTRSPTGRSRTPLPPSTTFPHELVAEDVAGPHEQDVAAEQVQVRAARGGPPHPQDDVVVVEDLRVRDDLHRHLVDPGPGRRPHRAPSLPAGGAGTITEPLS